MSRQKIVAPSDAEVRSDALAAGQLEEWERAMEAKGHMLARELEAKNIPGWMVYKARTGRYSTPRGELELVSDLKKVGRFDVLNGR